MWGKGKPNFSMSLRGTQLPSLTLAGSGGLLTVHPLLQSCYPALAASQPIISRQGEADRLPCQPPRFPRFALAFICATHHGVHARTQPLLKDCVRFGTRNNPICEVFTNWQLLCWHEADTGQSYGGACVQSSLGVPFARKPTAMFALAMPFIRE